MDAIVLKNISFSFKNDSSKIIDNLSLTVPYGKIYVVYGPSGCGKTTLLRLILGRITCGAGSIKVFNDAPGKQNQMIGFMPQEISLSKQLTVLQSLIYYGQIYGMNKYQVYKRYSHF